MVQDSTSKPVGNVRWLVIFWVFVIAAISYLDRNNLSIALSSIKKEFGLDNQHAGYLLSAFVFGYMLTQPIVGRLADRFGPRKMITFAILWWSLLTVMITVVPAGLASSFVILLSVRILLGIGEAIIFPASNRLVATSIPTRERGLANGIIFAGVGFGGAVAVPLITFFIIHHGWRWSFYACSILGLLAGIVWLFLVKDRPSEHKSVSKEELAYIEAGLPTTATGGPLTAWWRVVGQILSDGTAVVLTVSYFCYGYAGYIFLSWFFTYLTEVRGMNLKEAGAIYGMLPFIAMAIASPLGGKISDMLFKSLGERLARSSVAIIGMVLAAVFMWAATQVVDVKLAAIVLAGGAGSLYLAQSAYWAVSADIGGKSAGMVSGVMNMGAQFGGFITASLTPYVAKHYGWSASFELTAVICAVGGLLWIVINPAKSKLTKGEL